MFLYLCTHVFTCFSSAAEVVHYVALLKVKLLETMFPAENSWERCRYVFLSIIFFDFNIYRWYWIWGGFLWFCFYPWCLFRFWALVVMGRYFHFGVVL